MAQNRIIAIPVAEGKLSAHFGHAPMFFLYHIEGNKIIKEQAEIPPKHEFGVIPNWLADTKVTDLITGGIGPKAVNILNSRNINVYTGAPVTEAKKIIQDFLNGNLETRANLCDHGEDHHCKH